ncbi:hypothetical protein [Embleya sp. NPDC005575]|uniref:hypothetical protein n=1 Tax=Embleya sp. NPDC005575 TaxID=3156892 RepID=UPI00339F2E84
MDPDTFRRLETVVKGVPALNDVELAWRLGSLQSVLLELLTQALTASQEGRTTIPVSAVTEAIEKYARRTAGA